jgi:predicted GIY-YIG superfamily endonuclease
MEFIYVLELQGGKYYVGKTKRTVQERFEEHRTGKGSACTKRYQPIRVVESFERSGAFDEDNTTKTYMQRKGIDNVRGGSYSNVHLTTAQVEVLTREFRGADDTCNICGEPTHFARSCPNNIPPQAAAHSRTSSNSTRDGQCLGVTASGSPCKRTLYLNQDGFCTSHEDQASFGASAGSPPQEPAAYGRTSSNSTRAGQCLGVTASGSRRKRTRSV